MRLCVGGGGAGYEPKHNASEASKLEATEYLLLRSLPCRVSVCIYIYRYKKLWLSTSMYYSLFATRVFACSAVPVGHVCLSLERS